jgi:uncharacterized protein YjdB
MDLIQEGAVVVPEEDYSFDETSEEFITLYQESQEEYGAEDADIETITQLALSDDDETLEERKAACAATLYEGMINLETRISVAQYALSSTEFKQVISDVINSNPELFFVRNGYRIAKITLPDEDETQIVNYCYGFYEYTISDSYVPDRTKIGELQQELEEKKEEILSDIIMDGMSSVDKALVIHDYIVLNTEYDYSAYLEYMSSSQASQSVFDDNDFDIYGMLIKGKSVCQGYSLTYKYLMEAAGLDDIGFASNSNHIWNTVTLDGDSYYVDCTWDDPTWDTLGNVKHRYFLKGESNFNHTIVDTDRQCDGNEYDDAFWCNVDSAILCYEGSYYYIGDDGDLYRENFQGSDIVNEESGKVLSLNLSKTDVWNYDNAAKLAMVDFNVIYHDSKNIYYYNLENQTTGILCQPDLEENELIYGVRYQNGVFQYATRNEDTDETTTYQNMEQNIYTYSLPESLLEGTVESDVDVPVESIVISGENQIKLTQSTKGYSSEKITLTAQVLPENASDKRIRAWTSSDTSVAIVDINGVVKGISPGIVTITAISYDESVQGEYQVNVECDSTVVSESGEASKENTGADDLKKTETNVASDTSENLKENSASETLKETWNADSSDLDVTDEDEEDSTSSSKYVGWKEIKGKRYYYKNGVMTTGWKTIKNKKYYFNKKGVMQTGWKTIKNKKYYFNEKGVMQTGWRTIKKKKYYFNKKGVMQTGWVTIKKKQYYFAKDGHLVR